MSDKSEALRLADALDEGTYLLSRERDATAAELRSLHAEVERLRADAERWRSLYRRAVNEANGLTNYVEDRPELRRAERNLTAIKLEARVAEAARKDGA